VGGPRTGEAFSVPEDQNRKLENMSFEGRVGFEGARRVGWWDGAANPSVLVADTPRDFPALVIRRWRDGPCRGANKRSG
jgi:hypothetical protein